MIATERDYLEVNGIFDLRQSPPNPERIIFVEGLRAEAPRGEPYTSATVTYRVNGGPLQRAELPMKDRTVQLSPEISLTINP